MNNAALIVETLLAADVSHGFGIPSGNEPDDRCGRRLPRPVAAPGDHVQSAATQLGRRIQMAIHHHTLFRPITKTSLALREGRVASVLSEALQRL